MRCFFLVLFRHELFDSFHLLYRDWSSLLWEHGSYHLVQLVLAYEWSIAPSDLVLGQFYCPWHHANLRWLFQNDGNQVRRTQLGHLHWWHFVDEWSQFADPHPKLPLLQQTCILESSDEPQTVARFLKEYHSKNQSLAHVGPLSTSHQSNLA